MSKQLHELKPGEVISIGNKIYGRCADCGSIIRVNKPVLGSMHLCLTEEERQQRGQ